MRRRRRRSMQFSPHLGSQSSHGGVELWHFGSPGCVGFKSTSTSTHINCRERGERKRNLTIEMHAFDLEVWSLASLYSLCGSAAREYGRAAARYACNHRLSAKCGQHDLDSCPWCGFGLFVSIQLDTMSSARRTSAPAALAKKYIYALAVAPYRCDI